MTYFTFLSASQPRPGRTPFRKLLPVFLVAVAACAAPLQGGVAETSPAHGYGPGHAELTVTDERNDRLLTGEVWYPASEPGSVTPAYDSKVWLAPYMDTQSEPAAGSFPLLVVSHGMYGNTRNQAWLGSELARRGFVVAMVNHPGTSTFLRDPEHARQLWERPADLSRLISYMLTASPLRERIDESRIYAAGHSLGGMTVMLLAGAEFDGERYRSICREEPVPVVCKVLGGWSVAETDSDMRQMETSRKDPRVSRVISMDLGGTLTFSPESLAAIDIPVLVFGAGRGDMIDQDIESRALAAALPAGSTRDVELAGAGHFDFMGVCKPGAYALLAEEEPGDEMVCVKGTGERQSQHEKILLEILSFLQP